MVMFGIVKYRKNRGGDAFEPALPSNWGCFQIAAPSWECRWALCQLLPPKSRNGTVVPAGVCLVQGRALTILTSGYQWPPALAWAREGMADAEDPATEPDAFVDAHSRLVEAYLQFQPAAPFRLARLKCDRMIGGVFAGEYVWIVAYRDGQVGWVTSGDFFIYSDPPSAFESLEDSDLARIGEWMRARPAHLAGP
jgi:hypothetical protein